MKLQGIIPPMVTPLKGDNELDFQGAEQVIEHMINGGVHGIFILGTTGEPQCLTYELRYKFVDFVCSCVAERVPVLVGVTDTCMDESIRLGNHAKECGASGLVAASPYYYGPSQQELIEYFTALSESLPLPLYLYNIPAYVKVNLEPKTVATLASMPNIAGIKDSSGNMGYFQTLMYMLGDNPDFAMYSGLEELTGECVLMGADGGINGGANLYPRVYVKMYEAAKAGDLKKVRELQKIIMQIATTFYSVGKYGSSYLKGVKCALSILGICDDYIAYPYRKFKEEEREKIRAAIESIEPKLHEYKLS